MGPKLWSLPRKKWAERSLQITCGFCSVPILWCVRKYIILDIEKKQLFAFRVSEFGLIIQTIATAASQIDIWIERSKLEIRGSDVWNDTANSAVPRTMQRNKNKTGESFHSVFPFVVHLRSAAVVHILENWSENRKKTLSWRHYGQL